MKYEKICKIRDFYRTKKQKWANEGHGDKYGYDLAPPYEMREIVEYETRVGFKLPNSLRSYLVGVSREIFVYSYPTVIELYNPGRCVIPLNNTYTSYYEDEYDNDEYDCDDGMIVVGDGGCSFRHLLVINGNHAGWVWYSDGDRISRMVKFNEYLSKPMMPPPEYSPSTMGEMARAINFLMIASGEAVLKYTT